MMSNTIKVIRYVVLIMAIYIVATGVYDGFRYAKYYDYPIERIMTEELGYSDWGGTIKKSYGLNDLLDAYSQSFHLLNGTLGISELEFDTTDVTINTDIKYGNLKLLITDEDNKVLFYGEVKEELQLTIPKRSITVKMVGKWVWGKMEIKSIT